jgi:hypothetical protein
MLENLNLGLSNDAGPQGHPETPYAILSHTWNEQEVTFQDINDLPKARRMAGFSKIRGASAGGTKNFHICAYIWIDTSPPSFKYQS